MALPDNIDLVPPDPKLTLAVLDDDIPEPVDPPADPDPTPEPPKPLTEAEEEAIALRVAEKRNWQVSKPQPTPQEQRTPLQIVTEKKASDQAKGIYLDDLEYQDMLLDLKNQPILQRQVQLEARSSAAAISTDLQRLGFEATPDEVSQATMQAAQMFPGSPQGARDEWVRTMLAGVSALKNAGKPAAVAPNPIKKVPQPSAEPIGGAPITGTKFTERERMIGQSLAMGDGVTLTNELLKTYKDSGFFD